MPVSVSTSKVPDLQYIIKLEFSSSSTIFEMGKISIFLASGSFSVKNDNIHRFFFSLFWLQIVNLPASLQNKNTRVGPFPWKQSVLQKS